MDQENTITNSDQTINTLSPIYSPKAVWGFSLFFAPVFGGFLLRQNLIEDNKKKEGNLMLIVSILFTLITFSIVTYFEPENSSLTYLLNMGWGAILSGYFHRKYYPEKDYKFKKIWKPLIISLLIMIPFLLLALYSLEQNL